uniref:Leucine-rich repeat-containing protein 15 n=2 Tax=Anoplophora glabripennis TaxID=217634 RepID=V5GRH4_ANOGL
MEPDSFKGLAGVNVLILKDIAVPVINPGTFSDLELMSLVLQGDQITDIKPGAFKNSKMSLLRIANTNLKKIRRGVFNDVDVMQLDLFYNKISSIEDGALAGIPNLYTLKLENNALTSFDARKIFQGIPKLQILHLHNNNLASLRRSTFEGLTDLTKLVVSSNQITHIEPGTFNLPNLKILNLSNNKIKKLDKNILSGDGLTALWELYLNYNELTSLPTSFLSELPNLRKVGLADNPWECRSLDLTLKWVEENLTQGFQEQEAKPTCVE